MMVRVLLLGVLLFLLRFAYVITLTGESCNRGDFCFFSLPPDLVSVIASTSPGADDDHLLKSVQFYSSVFRDLISDGFLSPHSKSLCVEATPAAPEVFSLRELGVKDSIGISKKASRPLVVKGEAHSIPFQDNTFDFIFSGGSRLGKSLKPLEFADEITRTLKPQGIAVVHVAATDTYSFNSFLDLFNSCSLVKMRDLDSPPFDSPHIREFVIQKYSGGHHKKNSGGGKCWIPGYKTDLIRDAEPLIQEEPLKPWITLKRNIQNVKYIPSMVDIRFKSRYVYVDVGARSYGSSIGSWFKKQYPKQNKTFDVFAIEADKAFHEEYKIKKKVQLLPYAAWVRNETLSFEINHDPGKEVEAKAMGRGMGRIQPVKKSSSSLAGEVNLIQGFDFADWLKKSVRERDFVVMKMDVEGTEFDLIPRLIKTGAICLIDELFLECHYNRWQRCCPGQRSQKYNKTYNQCLQLFTSLRQSGVLVHQWCNHSYEVSFMLVPPSSHPPFPFMGVCCSKGAGIIVENGTDDGNEHGDAEADVRDTNDGAIIRSSGSSKHVSMAIKQGKKGINQDAMTVWENFGGEEDMIFCGVFDGHGPMGHKISRHICDSLPSRVHSRIRCGGNVNIENDNNSKSQEGFLEKVLVTLFKRIDSELGLDSPYDSFCSGTTAVTVLKQGDCLVIANLGDSRAVLGTRGSKNNLKAVQLTVDLKPCVQREAERIVACKGRVFAMEEEPDVYRVWMPDDDCPGLAMSRAFGDFCLKDYGLLCVPEVFFRKVGREDEFVVLATDGIWDVLSNEEVVKIVGSCKDRSVAADTLVQRAARAWRTKFPTSKADDCAVVVLYLNHPREGNVSRAVSTVSWRSGKSNRV